MQLGRSELVKTIEASIFALSLILLALVHSSPGYSNLPLSTSRIGDSLVGASVQP